jgi:hypothetical protein
VNFGIQRSGGIAGMLKPLKPRKLNVDSPEAFRKVLARFLSDLRTASGRRGPKP